jgi:hypothetical protein
MVAALSGCVAGVSCGDSGSSFAVRNIENVTRIELTDSNEHLILSKTEESEWMVSSFRANMQNILNLMTILSDIDAVYPLPKMYDSTYSAKKITDDGIRIKIFKGKKVVKSYHLLITGKENAEVIGLMNGKRKPYVVELPGREIDFGDYIVMKPAFWENNILFSFNARQLKYLKVDNMETPDSSFSIEINDSIALYGANGRNYPFNKFRMDAYLSYFSNISFGSNLNITDSEKQKIASTKPMYCLTVASITDSMTCYIHPISDNNLDDYGNPLVYDRDFFYLTVPQKNLFAKAAWLKFDILLEELSYFLEY